MIHYVYGNPGTGKTQYIYSALMKDSEFGQKAILIVPEQMTVSAEHSVVELLPPTAQLNIEILNFSRLANRLFREHGGLAYNFASKGLQKILMWKALCTALPFLSEYQLSSNNDFTLVDAMLLTYKELVSNGISFEELEQVAMTQTNSVLSKKIKDISTVCSIYSNLLNENFTDENNQLIRLVDLLNNKKCLTDINIYIDGFTSFTGVEHNIIKCIMEQAKSLTITVALPHPGYSGIDTLSIEQCSAKLRRDSASLGQKCNTTILEKNYRTNYAELDLLSSHLWNIENCEIEHIQNESQSHSHIELYRAADIYDECEFAAALIRELIESGYRFKDISIVARNIDNYKGVLEPALDKMDLKYFISEKVDLILSPIARLIISAINIILYGWRKEDLIVHIKTGLCDISPRDSDIFESYITKWNITGKQLLTEEPWNMNPDGYVTNISDKSKEILAIVNGVKSKLINKLQSFSAELKCSESYAQMCVATLRYLEELNVSNAMLNLSNKYFSNGKTREAMDCAKMYDKTIDALDCVCDALSSEIKTDINTFASAINIAFAETDLGSIPTSQDEIMIGSANMLRVTNIRCTLILGACDNEFPANADQNGLLSDSERNYLISQGLQLQGDKQVKASDELYYFRRAVATPSDKLIVFTRADAEPSIAFTRIKSILKNLEIRNTSSILLPRLKSITAASEYLTILSGTPAGVALSKLLNQFQPSSHNSICENNSTRISASHDSISYEDVNSIHHGYINLSQSIIESYSNCKFAYCCKYLLKINDGKKAEFSYNDIGTFVHHVLEKYLYNVFIIKKGIFPNQEEKVNIVENIISNYIDILLPDDYQRSARVLHLISRLKQISILFIDDLTNEFSDSSFIPEFFELHIGSKKIPSVRLQLSNGDYISLKGIIDRVDVFRKNGYAYLKVVDYKTGSKTFSISDISERRNLQLLLYIYALTSQNEKNTAAILGGNPVAAGITYLSYEPKKNKVARFENSNSSKQQNYSDIKRSGLILLDDDVIEGFSHTGNSKLLMKTSRKDSFIEKQALHLLYNQVCDILKEIGEEIISGNINALPKLGNKTCKFCQYALICKSSNNYK